ncbi:MAG: cytochrome c peroxidase [Pseudomonadales bacterium]
MSRPGLRWLSSAVLCSLLHGAIAFAHGDHQHDADSTSSNNSKPEPKQIEVLAPGYQALRFDAPAAGSYTLPELGKAGDGPVLLSDGQAVQLHDLLGDRYVLLSFIYTQCDDVNGCPLATFVTSKVQNAVMRSEVLRDQVRFVSLSFDPANDTPQAMRRYGSSFIKPGFDWRFVTTDSLQNLDPILAKYDQSVLREVDENGEDSGAISHILRVFLIDKEKRFRNIYSTSFLHPTTVLNDLETLARADAAQEKEIKKQGSLNQSAGLHGAGDYKEGYDQLAYTTQADSLEQRTGQTMNLLANARTPGLGLPALPKAELKRLSKQKIDLGRALFFDRRLSLNNTFSCAMCHVPEQGFANNELATAVGFEGRTVRRNAPSLYNAALMPTLFHDARESSLEQQIWAPLLARNEMANPSVGFVIDKISSDPDYRKHFEMAFGEDQINMQSVGEAFASYQRTLLSGNSPFDRWQFAKDQNALSDSAKRGFELFKGKASCVSCHSIGERSALFTDSQLHNTGIGYSRSMFTEPARRKVLLAPGVWIDVDTSAIADASEPVPSDLGRYEITQNPDDRWKYRTPGLRNVALSAPYMHDGSLATLKDVLEFYNRGGDLNPLLDPLMRPLGLTQEELSDLRAFLESLTGDNVDDLISDAFAATVGNVK